MLWCTAIIMSLMLANGCGRRSGLERVNVSGAASYAGKPIEIGQIRFIPVDARQAPVTVEGIRDGAYDSTSTGGVPVGEYRIEIKMYDAEEYKNAPRVAGSPAVKQLLPSKYNRESELAMQIASGSGSIKKDFELEP